MEGEVDEGEGVEGIGSKFKGGDFSIHIKCPKCNSEEVVVEEDKHGYFSVLSCNKCRYKKKN